ncbi:MAG TPA: TSUP family transporter [Chitinophagales bacterium]|nr:TSUP family transporter [Chitinophagales bacterium]
MEHQTLIVLSIAFLLIAILYSSVGHAGASGYLAVMALMSFPVASIKPISLVLNILVSLIATHKFLKGGCFDRKVFEVFAVTSIPMAFVGGYLKIDTHLFKVMAGLFLIVSALLLISRQFIKSSGQVNKINVQLALVIGAVIGWVSGLLGVGGGIFLSPIIILFG